jgi:hypothetical protein
LQELSIVCLFQPLGYVWIANFPMPVLGGDNKEVRMSDEESIIGVALKAGQELLVYAEGNPAQVVAVGVAAAAVVVAVGVGYGVYCGG